MTAASIPFIAMYITLGILVAGIIFMAFGNRLNITHSTRLMCARIISQALAVAAIGLLYFWQSKF